MTETFEQMALRVWNEHHENGKKLPDVPRYARRIRAVLYAAKEINHEG